MTAPIALHPLATEDLELLLAWRSNPRIYRHFRDQDGPLEWSSHVEWFANRDPARHDWIIHYNGRRVGVVYVTADDEVGVYIGEESAWGQGIAHAALEAAIDRVSDREPFTAEIHVDNDASKHLFTSVGFEQTDRDGDWLRLQYRTSDSPSPDSASED